MRSIQNHELIDLIRERRGDMSLIDFAHSMGISPGTLSDIFNYQRPVTAPIAHAMGYKRMKTVHITFAKRGRS